MPAYIVTTRGRTGADDPYSVVVQDELDESIVEMSALSLKHAGEIATALALLLPKLRPDLDIVVAGAETPRPTL